jgi:hypothetical protein
MLKRLTDTDATFTDLTPIPAVVQISTALGFRVLAQSMAVIPLPVHLFGGGKGTEIIPVEDQPPCIDGVMNTWPRVTRTPSRRATSLVNFL